MGELGNKLVVILMEKGQLIIQAIQSVFQLMEVLLLLVLMLMKELMAQEIEDMSGFIRTVVEVGVS